MKLKINGKKFSFFFLISIATLVGSCVVEESFTENDFSMDQSLIREAEEWYGSNLLGSNNARSNSLVEGNPVWGKSKTQIHKGKQVIEVPIKLKVKNIFAQSDKEFKNRSGDYRLLLFKIGEEQFRPYLLKVEIETSEFKTLWKDLNKLSLSEIPNQFQGRYIFFDLGGKFVGDWKIENGERVKSRSYFRPIPSKSSNARISNYTYHCVITTYYTVTEAGSETTREVEYEVWDCIFTPMFSSADPDDSGGGGDGEACYEPHPDVEGFMVPCGSLDPECPCCHLPETQRAACEADEPPCEDLPLKNMEIASPGASGKNGGRYGMTRTNGTQYHDGLDIATEPGNYVFSPFTGTVIDRRISFTPGEYGRASYGNYVTIKSIDTNGYEFYFKYNHLDYVLVNIGDSIEASQVIGISGTTGNAASNDVKNKHVHIQARGKDSNGNWTIKKNPEDFLKIIYNSNGNILINPCN